MLRLHLVRLRAVRIILFGAFWPTLTQGHPSMSLGASLWSSSREARTGVSGTTYKGMDASKRLREIDVTLHQENIGWKNIWKCIPGIHRHTLELHQAS